MDNPKNKKTSKQVTEEQLKNIVKQLSEKNQSFWQQLI